MGTAAAKVSFPEPIKLPTPPKIVAAGTAVFNTRGDTGVTFEAEIPLPYFVFLQGDAGYQQRSIDVFAVVSKRPDGFSLRAGDNNSRASVDWAVVK